MSLSVDLIDQFVDVTNDEKKEVSDGVAYGTVVINGESTYVQLDGSTYNTPVTTTTNVKHGERVAVLIKNHTATITGNFSSPAARTEDVESATKKISEFEIIVADKVSTDELTAELAAIDTLLADKATIKELNAAKAEITELVADKADIEDLNAVEASIGKLEADYADLNVLVAEKATIKDLEVTDQHVRNLDADYGEFKELTTDKFEATDATVKTLAAQIIDTETLDTKYANINFANIGEAAIMKIFASTGLIDKLTVGDGMKITGELAAVTINADNIKSGTITADRLLLKGANGLYYQLNYSALGDDFFATDLTEEEQQELQNGIHGENIIANSITAKHISVDDLTAFGATIANFTIVGKDGDAPGKLYSDMKESVDNTTRGIYMDTSGQFAVGDINNFIKFYKDTDGSYKLAINANKITLGSSGKNVEESIDDIASKIVGTNLLRQTATMSGWETTDIEGVGESTIGNGVLTIRIVDEGDTGWSSILTTCLPLIPMDTIRGKQLIVSFDVKADVENSNHRIYMVPTSFYSETGKKGAHRDISREGNVTTEWQRVSYAFPEAISDGFFTSAPALGIGDLFGFRVYNREPGSTLYIRKIKLEVGDKATDWSPAPEDASDSIEAVKSTTISGVDVQYASHTSSTEAPTSGWSTTAPEWEDGKYMWQRTVTTYGDGTIKTSDPTCITGATGQNGSASTGTDGRGVKTIVENYYQSTSPTEMTGGSWSTNYPGWLSGTYIWTKSVITYTDGTVISTTPICVTGPEGQKGDKGDTGDQGPQGDKGDAGVGIASVDVYYYLSTSSTSLSGGSWSTSAPTWVDGKYMWSKTVTTDTNGTSTESGAVCITGQKGATGVQGNTGATGATGTGIELITEQYYLSTSKETQVGGSWSEMPPTWSTGMYVWTRSKIVYKNPASTAYTTPVCDSSWEAVNELEIGGRNLLMCTGDMDTWLTYSGDYGSSSVEDGVATLSVATTGDTDWSNVFLTAYPQISMDEVRGKQLILSLDLKASEEMASSLYIVPITYHSSTGGSGKHRDIIPVIPATTEWQRVTYVFPDAITDEFFNLNDNTTVGDLFSIKLYPYKATEASVYIRKVKLEIGDKATSWTPAPEDVDGDISNAQNTADVAQDSADSANVLARDAKTLADATDVIVSALSDTVGENERLTLELEQAIAVIQKSLSTLVIDGNDTTLLHQDGTSFTFNFADLNDSMNSLESKMGDALEHRGYIQFEKNDGNPYILISAVTTGIKLKLTSTAIEFVNAAGESFTSIVADTEGRTGMEVDNETVTGELRQSNSAAKGEFVWQVRSNGNYGLSWKG